MRAEAHERLGWALIAVFGLFGLVLEALHAFKAGFYLDGAAETRRLLFRLAHAHGVLLGLVHLGFAASAHRRPSWEGPSRKVASRTLVAASLLVPVGFLLGGVSIYGTDPNPLVLLTPLGGGCLVAGAIATWFGVRD